MALYTLIAGCESLRGAETITAGGHFEAQGSVEFQLIVDCCRASFAGTSHAASRPSSALDWDRLMRLARFHRVQGLVWNGLRPLRDALPDRSASELAADATSIATQNLAAAVECGAILNAFREHGVALMFVKGLTLGQLGYGNPALKAAIDVDVVVDLAQVSESARVLRELGFRLIDPEGAESPDQLERWHRQRKESVWQKAALQLDLHTRLADNPRLIPTIDARSPTQLIEIGNGIALPTLAREQLFAYLAVHGASSAWFRLKWISDFAALLAGQDSAAIDHLYRSSQQLGAGRAVGQALLLADHLFGTLQQTPRIRAELLRDLGNRWLCRAALRQLTGEPVEPTSALFGTATIHWTQLLLLPGLSFKASELWRQTRDALF